MSNLSGIFGNSENNKDTKIISSNSGKPDTGLFANGNNKLERFTKSLNENTQTEISEKNNEKK